MAKQELESFEAGRLGLVIPYRELPIWFGCALWPLAGVILETAVQRHANGIPDWAWEVTDALTLAIFDWCWMAALCRTTARPLLTFPADRGFWLFLMLQIALAVVWGLWSGLVGFLGFAAVAGIVPLLDWSGTGVQVIAIVLLLFTLVLSTWVALRLSIWPAHCVATGTLVGPQVIWRKMRDHSLDMLIIGVITIGPILLVLGAMYWVIHALPALALNLLLLKLVGLAVGHYARSAFYAASLIAYFTIFAGAATEKRVR